MTLDQLRQIMPYAGPRAARYFQPLTDAMLEFGIDTPARQAAFLAQVAHESASLRYVRELADGTAYEGRADLGNTRPGDGPRYKGRGLIQITGRANYRATSLALYGDEQLLLDHPQLLEEDEPACRSAAWFWWMRGLNTLADTGQFRAITRKINGGFNGYADRLASWEKAKGVLA
ncbi:MAG: glycoside hydrolase family 19 protein [Dechloromonas sp.]|nr:glycoside hydrolase family 19 protein [Dechloromonas sp.]